MSTNTNLLIIVITNFFGTHVNTANIEADSKVPWPGEHFQ